MEKQLTIVQINDSHGYLDIHPELFWEKGESVYRMAGGYARIAAVLKAIRAENPDRVLFVDGGDTFHGTLPVVETKGEVLLPILNSLGINGMTGHWEFAYTPRGFQRLAARLNYPMLAMNVYEKDSHHLLFKPYEVLEVGGIRVGLAGIASNIVDKTMPQYFSEGVYFTNGRDELPRIVQVLRDEEKVDLVVMVSHLGFPQDMQMLAEVRGIDVALSAHTHHRLESAVQQNGALVTQSGSHGSFLTRLDLTIAGGKVTNYSHRLIEINMEIDPDPATQDLVQAALAPYRQQLSEVAGEALTPLDRGRNLETTMDNFLLDALLDHTQAEVAFSNGWRYGVPVTAGPIRLNDLYNMAPMDPPVSTVDLRGSEILEMLEKNLEHTFSRNPFDQMGGYVKRAAGIRTYFKIENPPHHRIQKCFIGKAEVKPESVYRAAFITEQGVPAGYGENRQTLPEKTVEVLKAYLRKTRQVEVGLRDSFVVV